MSFFWHLLPFSGGLSCTESVWQRNYWLATQMVKYHSFLANQWFLFCADSVQCDESVLRKLQKKFQQKRKEKKDMVKMKNQCTNKIRLGYLSWQYIYCDTAYTAHMHYNTLHCTLPYIMQTTAHSTLQSPHNTQYIALLILLIVTCT